MRGHYDIATLSSTKLNRKISSEDNFKEFLGVLFRKSG